MMDLLSFQKGIVAGSLIDPMSSQYNIGGYLRIPICFSDESYTWVLNHLIDEFPDFRSRFRTEGGLSQYCDERYEYKDFNEIVLVGSREEAETYIKHQMTLPYILSEALPLCHQRAVLCQEENYSYVMIKMHHSIADGFSSLLYADRLAELLTCVSNGQGEPPLEKRGSAMKAAIETEQAYLESQDFLADMVFWKNHLGEYSGNRGFQTAFQKAESSDLACSRHAFDIPRRTFDQFS